MARKHLIASSLPLLAAVAHAQTAPVEQVTVTGRMLAPPLQVGGFADAPLSRAPFAASRITAAELREAGATTLSELTRLDAGISDAYNAEGYWNALSARGFTLDNRFNYRRDGLPINAETSFALHNVQALEVLKGTSGIQAGTSAPGGLVNLVVKRPQGRLREATLGWREQGSVGAAVDLGERFGADGQLGVRVNASTERLDPQVRDARGERHLFALATEWRPGADTRVEAEVERSRQSQPSVPGFSLLGERLPSADEIDPRVNLNNQPWSLPVVFNNTTASLRLTQRLSDAWQLKAHGMTQRLRNDDRVAFPFGVFDPATYDCPQWCDRFAPDGSFTIWEFQSDNERRRSDALDLGVAGELKTGAVTHRVAAGVLLTRYEARFGPQLYDLAGTGRIDGSVVVPRSAGFADVNTNRDERSRELYLRDAMQLGERWSLWSGLRHTRIERESVRTDGSRPTAYDQSFTTPWLALAHRWTPQTLVYASWGQGIESEVVPNRPSRFDNAGEPLPALKSRQAELGIKHDGETFDASAALFDIDRPVAETVGRLRRIDGSARHRGVEGLLSWRFGPWQWHASAMWLDAERRGSVNASRNGLRPTNVPAHTLRLQTTYDVRALAGLALTGSVVREGDRVVLPDNSVKAPGFTRVDLGARYRHTAGAARLTWRVGVDNVFDERAWKETPYQYGHAYLFPLAPRTWRVSLQADL